MAVDDEADDDGLGGSPRAARRRYRRGADAGAGDAEAATGEPRSSAQGVDAQAGDAAAAAGAGGGDLVVVVVLLLHGVAVQRI